MVDAPLQGQARQFDRTARAAARLLTMPQTLQMARSTLLALVLAATARAHYELTWPPARTRGSMATAGSCHGANPFMPYQAGSCFWFQQCCTPGQPACTGQYRLPGSDAPTPVSERQRTREQKRPWRARGARVRVSSPTCVRLCPCVVRWARVTPISSPSSPRAPYTFETTSRGGGRFVIAVSSVRRPAPRSGAATRRSAWSRR